MDRVRMVLTHNWSSRASSAIDCVCIRRPLTCSLVGARFIPCLGHRARARAAQPVTHRPHFAYSSPARPMTTPDGIHPTVPSMDGWRRPASVRKWPQGVTASNQQESRMQNPTRQLHELGQSLWLDNIARSLLTSGTLRRYIAELSVSGLTSNPTIFDNAISKSNDYDTAIRDKLAAGKSGEDLFF